MLKNITFKIDEDNDIYEITINNVTYTLDDIYDSEYSELFDSRIQPYGICCQRCERSW